MLIYLHIGPEAAGAARLQDILSSKREQLKSKGILFPRSPGGKNHTRLFMAITDPDHVDPLRFNRGFADPSAQAELRKTVFEGLRKEVAQFKPQVLILSASQLATSLYRASELETLKQFLCELSSDIQIVSHIGESAQTLLSHYALQLNEGRSRGLDQEIALTAEKDWWQSAIDQMPRIEPMKGQFEETQGAAFWLDAPALQRHWEGVFGEGSFSFHPYEPEVFNSADALEAVKRCFDIELNLGRIDPVSAPALPSSATLARHRQFNEILLKYLANGDKHVPRQLWRGLLAEMSVNGPAPDPGSLAAITKRFDPVIGALSLNHPALEDAEFPTPDPADTWQEADPTRGFRASQYLLAAAFRIEKATKEKFETRLNELKLSPPAAATPAKPGSHDSGLTEAARKLMPPLAVQNFEKLKTSSFAPHNRMGAVDEEQLAAAYTPVPMRELPEGRSGNVIVGCMKNEAPYIVEWVAYHRAMGVDNFLIYTNDCSDGTSEILDRLQEMGVLQHRNNDNWKGNSPQQYALNQALKEPLIRYADWIIHIDVDEFINVRTGNGTLQDFYDAVPDATNVAMTWRLFGHNDVTQLSDAFVIDQFDTCAPKYCPKPHTVWGFKTMFKNIGAYEKISCHRPNKLNEGFTDKVRWVNGSGRDMTKEVAKSGWRNSKKSIGYDLLQLNHYALRSAESFLIKRQRGRALHVDRSIGINYWIRMDWSDFRDITIKRNLPRMRLEYDRLMQDESLRKWHEAGLDWHRAKAAELHGMPEFEDLYQQALKIKLTETERVAYALALDMES